MSPIFIHRLWNAQLLSWINEPRIRNLIDTRYLCVACTIPEGNAIKVISPANNIYRAASGRWDSGGCSRCSSSSDRRGSRSGRGGSGGNRGWRWHCKLSLTDRTRWNMHPWNIGYHQFLGREDDIRPPNTVRLCNCPWRNTISASNTIEPFSKAHDVRSQSTWGGRSDSGGRRGSIRSSGCVCGGR